MTTPLIVAFDGTDVGEDALAYGTWLAAAVEDTALVVDVYAEEPVNVLPGIGGEWVREMRHQARDALLRAERLADPDAKVEFRAVPGSSVARGLNRVAKQTQAEMIVLGSPHRGPLRRTGVGKTAERLLHGSDVPVLIAPRGSRDRQLGAARNIGCAFIPTPDGEQALHRAADIAQRSGAHLTLYTVSAHGMEARDHDRDREKRVAGEARLTLEEAASRAVAGLPEGVNASVRMLDGGVVDSLSALDATDCQLLVCGSRGYGPVGRVLLGGVSGRLVRKAVCPVMVVPRCAVEVW